VAGHLVGVLPSDLLPWRNALRPVKTRLIAPLAAIYRDIEQGEQVRGFATDTLADYLGDDAEVLFALLADADEQQFAPMFGRLTPHREQAVALGNAEVARTIPEDAGEADKEAMAIRQANAAVMLLRMGAGESVWPLLRHGPDPRVRSYVVHWLSPRGGDPQAVVARYEQEGDVTVKRALLLCLGEFELGESPKRLLTETLLTVYRNDPDAGLHAASEWLLRRWGQAEKLAAVDGELRQQEEQLAEEQDAQRRWYVNGQGQTFVVLDAGEFPMGSPESEAGRHSNERLHQRTVGRRFAISTKEVTRGQWRAFAESQSGRVWAADQEQQYIRTEDSPMTAMTWYEAAWYCNWLSEQEGVPRDQWCYEPNDRGQYGPGMKAKQEFWGLSGYRLPTEAEWEFACRAGASTSRYYGVTETLLPNYAWYQANGAERTWPVASLKPNDFGLFDMQGNAFEWVYDEISGYPSGSAAADAPNTSALSDSSRRVLRGGSFDVQASSVRSARRGDNVPAVRVVDHGFRPARTYHLSP
jgi:formylglycine-generating enzyme required for sulfatase activity